MPSQWNSSIASFQWGMVLAGPFFSLLLRWRVVSERMLIRESVMRGDLDGAISNRIEWDRIEWDCECERTVSRPKPAPPLPRLPLARTHAHGIVGVVVPFEENEDDAVAILASSASHVEGNGASSRWPWDGNGSASHAWPGHAHVRPSPLGGDANLPIRKEQMNKIVMNYFVTEGYVSAARAFSTECGTSPSVDLDTISERMLIRESVMRGDLDGAISLVNDLNPEILEHNPGLFFRLQQQRLIERVRAGDVESALAFAQEYLAPLGEENEALLESLERTISLLAFPCPASSPVGDLLGDQHRHGAASELNQAILTKQCQEKDPKLPVLLRLLSWSQKHMDDIDETFPRIEDLETGDLPEGSAAATATGTGAGRSGDASQRRGSNNNNNNNNNNRGIGTGEG
eukprot:CAMPEP_0198247978 /NCGR_PEP_ID=MMETSP1446-20131203/46749_1 /TAXON_ID=1461542 ORGANISM="Unidentified sp, Strain CCMP2111" /NCGR_SAMPLE_ID=MMETSP1446 /ASSEMBLY_ACC=CAM_ASM_001112 /LENGTH=401 /DNA_ID=CAMNT_0043932307 /DNA_START=346 /DNA_END=1548 /DNA_ORIENTATION=-